MRTTKTVIGIVLGASVALTSACGGSSGTKPAALPSSPSTSGTPSASASSSTPAPTLATSSSSAAAPASSAPAAAGVLTTDQLKAALLADADVSGYTVDPTADATDVKTDQEKVSVGGAICQKFLDASDALAPAYATVAEVDRTWQNQTKGTQVQLSVMSYPSAAKAKAIVTDVKAGAAGCKSLTAGDASTGGVVTMALSPLADVKAGDSSTAFVSVLSVSGFNAVLAVATVQVGATTLNVAIGGPGLDKAAAAALGTELKGYATKEAAKLKAAQHL